MDKLACMRAFVTVVEASGFSQAARRLGVSKALISKQVNQLDASLQFANATPMGELHVAAPTTFAEIHLMSAMSEFASLYLDAAVLCHCLNRLRGQV